MRSGSRSSGAHLIAGPGPRESSNFPRQVLSPVVTRVSYSSSLRILGSTECGAGSLLSMVFGSTFSLGAPTS